MKKINFIILASMLSLFSFSQNSEKKTMADNAVNKSSYIFIGELISSKPFYTKEKAIYTSNIVAIKSILKGNLTIGTIEIITDGGTMDGLSIKPNDNVFISAKSSVFFCNDADINSTPITFNNQNNKGLRIYDIVGFEDNTIYKSYGISNYFTKTTELFEYLN